jgi:hypothetical protein
VAQPGIQDNRAALGKTCEKNIFGGNTALPFLCNQFFHFGCDSRGFAPRFGLCWRIAPPMPPVGCHTGAH